MKYFVDLKEVVSSGREKYVEFQTPKATKEFWDEYSLYMSDESLKKSNLNPFIHHCVSKDILFDCETISKEDWQTVLKEAENFDKDTYDAVSELYEWIVNQFEGKGQRIILIWESERNLIHKINEDLVK